MDQPCLVALIVLDASDLYGNALDCQWLDITGIAPGGYQLQVNLNPGKSIQEISCMQTHTINDAPLPTVTITTPGSSPTEGVTTVSLVVTLSAASGQTVTVPWTVAGTATVGPGNDYTLPSIASLVFPEGTTTQTIMVNILEDSVNEADETVIINLGTPINLGADRTFDAVFRAGEPSTL